MFMDVSWLRELFRCMKSDDVRYWSLLSASVAGPPSCGGGPLEISGSKCSHFETSAFAYCYVRASLSVAQLSAARDVSKPIIFNIAVQCAWIESKPFLIRTIPAAVSQVTDVIASTTRKLNEEALRRLLGWIRDGD
jgi:hypothetical protein